MPGPEPETMPGTDTPACIPNPEKEQLADIAARVDRIDARLASMQKPRWQFDPLDTIVIIQTYPGNARLEISAVMQAIGIPLGMIRFVNMRDTICARNFAVKEHILPSGKRRAILFDADMIPGDATRALWETEGDVVGAYYPTGELAAWEKRYKGLKR